MGAVSISMPMHGHTHTHAHALRRPRIHNVYIHIHIPVLLHHPYRTVARAYCTSTSRGHTRPAWRRAGADCLSTHTRRTRAQAPNDHAWPPSSQPHPSYQASVSGPDCITVCAGAGRLEPPSGDAGDPARRHCLSLRRPGRHRCSLCRRPRRLLLLPCAPPAFRLWPPPPPHSSPRLLPPAARLAPPPPRRRLRLRDLRPLLQRSPPPSPTASSKPAGAVGTGTHSADYAATPPTSALPPLPSPGASPHGSGGARTTGWRACAHSGASLMPSAATAHLVHLLPQQLGVRRLIRDEVSVPPSLLGQACASSASSARRPGICGWPLT
eukprot:scaffold3076_cov117-Isochrysis_galbana.AAC.1